VKQKTEEQRKAFVKQKNLCNLNSKKGDSEWKQVKYIHISKTTKEGLSVYYFYSHAPFSPSDLGCRWPAIRPSEVEVFTPYPYIFPLNFPLLHLRYPTNALQRNGIAPCVPLTPRWGGRSPFSPTNSSLAPPVRRQILSLVPPIVNRNGAADPPDIINETCFQPANHDKIRLRPRPKVQP